eukprot:3123217-Alexandrium_andersonii.AAC.1
MLRCRYAASVKCLASMNLNARRPRAFTDGLLPSYLSIPFSAALASISKPANLRCSWVTGTALACLTWMGRSCSSSSVLHFRKDARLMGPLVIFVMLRLGRVPARHSTLPSTTWNA